MCHLEIIWLENYPTQSKPVVYRRYVDDTFLLFRSTEYAEKFKNYRNKQHKNFTPFFFYKQFIFDPRPKNCLSFSKKSPQKIV